ncbi:MAG: gliding motility-associated C-terminal domain-containing protein [Bacteroidota bacterium]
MSNLSLAKNCIFAITLTLSFSKFYATDDRIKFIENKGQWNCPEKFRTQIGNNNIYFSDKGLTYNLVDESVFHEMEHEHESFSSQKIKAHCIKMNFLNSNEDVRLCPLNKRKESLSFFQGNNQANWKSKVNSYNDLIYYEIFKGIDVIYYNTNNNLKYDFIVAKNADYKNIKMQFEGQNSISIENGMLKITTSVGTIYEKAPYAYQILENGINEVPCKFTLNNNTVGFEFPKGYLKSAELVIDPNIIFSTYSSTSQLISADGATYDGQGNLYMAGGTLTSNYVSTPGAYTMSGTNMLWNMVIEKYASNGSTLLYGALIGGTQNATMPGTPATNYPYSLFCDSNDNLFVLGTTNANNFPTTAGCYDASSGGNDDYVVCKLNPTGTSLLASTYLGGSQQEGGGFQTKVSSIYVDAIGDVFVSGLTNSSNYPTTSGVFQSTLAGATDGIVSKLNNSLSSLVWSTYIGGLNDDNVCDIKIAQNTDIYICGNTSSLNFPNTTGGLNTSNSGNQDGFVSRLNSTATSIIQSTYLGTAQKDKAKFLQIDSNNEIYILGSTTNSSYPVSSGAYNSPGTFNYFIHKLNTSLNSTIFSACVGGANNSSSNINEFVPTAFGIDLCNNVYFSGSNLNGGLPITSGALSSTSKSIYFCSISKNGNSLLYGSYYGGAISSGSTGSHIHESTNNRINENGILFHTECTVDNNYNLLNQVSTDNNTSNNAASFKFDFGFLSSSYTAVIPANTIVNPTCGNNQGAAAVSVTGGSGNFTYSWSPSGGNTNSASNLAPGTYTVIVTDLNPDCGNGVQTLTVNLINTTTSQPITALAQTTNAICGSNNGSITLSITGGSNNYTYNWTPSISNSTTANNLPAGNYTVIISDNTINCPATSDTLIISITSGSLSATESHTNILCFGGSDGAISIIATGNQGPVNYQWSPNISSASNANNLNAGLYNVSIIDSVGCEVNMQILVSQPSPPSVITSTFTSNSPDLFSASVNITGLTTPLSYTWSSIPAQYQQNAENLSPGTYTVLISDINGCSTLATIILEGELIIPNVITSNGDGINDFFKIKNLPINSKISIYNRWGTKLYESDNYQNNWDGSQYNDGTYFYVLSTSNEKKHSGYFQLIK